MFFFSLAIFLLTSWCLPWWSVAIAALLIGWFQPRAWGSGALSAWAAGCAWAALSYVEDGRNFGLVSRRLAGLFQLPHPVCTYFLMGVLGFVTAFLCTRSGNELRALLRPKTE